MLVQELMRAYRLKLVALTRGESGSQLYPAGSPPADHPGIRPPAVADTIGAGDAFTAALTLGLLRGEEVGRINEFANRLASYVCSQAGATPEIPDALRGSPNDGTRG